MGDNQPRSIIGASLIRVRPIVQTRPQLHPWLTPAIMLYVAVASGLAAAGDTRSAVLLLAAVVVTFPFGLAALIGVYGVYVISVAISRGLEAQVMAGNGWGPHWFILLNEVLVTLLFAAAAFGNAVLVRRLAAKRALSFGKVRRSVHPV